MKNKLQLLLVLTVLFFSGRQTAIAQLCFTQTNYPAGNTNTVIATDDFNNDGDLDLIVAHDVFEMYLLLGNGLGSFGAATMLGDGDSSFVISSRCIITGDFNTDGNADLAVATYYELKILFGDGAGDFPIITAFTVGSYPLAVCSADFNGDGEIDLATANSGSISVLTGDGAGNFSPHVEFISGNDMNAITSGDFNGDGDADLAATNNYNGGGLDSVWVYLGNGSGSFATAARYITGEGPYSICNNDFNADGFDDLAVANTNSHTLSVLLSQGASGAFSAAIDYPVATNGTPFSIVSADFNLDGIPDLASGNHSNSVSVLLGNGDGSFGDHSDFPALYGPWEIITGDFNADGRPDLATANQSSSNVSVLLNNEVVNCTGCALNNGVTVPNICMVSTDSATAYQYNVIIWDNSLYTNVDSFIVYRKDAITSTYLRIGATSKDSLSLFVDTQFSIGGPNGGNPMYSSWFYKLAIRDTCGNIGEKSPYHQTMFFQQNGANFSWNAYTVESGQTNPVTGYSFLRDDNNNGNWNVLVNTVGLSTTDPDYANYPNGNWRIDALGFSCTPNRNVTQAHSNPIKPIVAGIEQPDIIHATIYPNPATNSVTIQSDFKKGIYQLNDITGKTLLQGSVTSTKFTLDISTLSSGVYFISVADGDKQVFGKVVKE